MICCLPRLNKNGFQIGAADKLFVIREGKESKEEMITWSGYNDTPFNGSSNLPRNEKRGAIEARYGNGLLHLVLPRLQHKPVPVAQNKSAFNSLCNA